MKIWRLSVASAVLIFLPISVQADETGKDERDKLGMSTLTIPGKTTHISSSHQISTLVPFKAQTKPILCDAELDLTYYQNDTTAEVSTRIDSSTCPEHQGRYRIRLFYKSGQGETQRLDREAQWTTTSGNNKVTENFTLGDNAELLRVNGTIIHCECSENIFDAN